MDNFKPFIFCFYYIIFPYFIRKLLYKETSKDLLSHHASQFLMASALVGGRPIVEHVAFTTRRDITSAARICGSREWKKEDNRVEEVAY